jgi:heme A synthase
MQNGGFHKNPLMRLTLWLTLLFLSGFFVTNFLLYFDRMGLTPSSVVSYYNGSEEDFRPARSYQSMIEVTHSHTVMMAFVLLLLTHLVIFTPYSKTGKTTIILATFLAGFLQEASGWLVRFVSADFALLKIVSFLSLQACLFFLLFSLGLFLLRAAKEETSGNGFPLFPRETKADRSEYLFSSQGSDKSAEENARHSDAGSTSP